MLTPEERQRIEEEERKRIAEEQYRAEVRAKLQGAPAAPVRKPSRFRGSSASPPCSSSARLS